MLHIQTIVKIWLLIQGPHDYALDSGVGGFHVYSLKQQKYQQ